MVQKFLTHSIRLSVSPSKHVVFAFSSLIMAILIATN